MYLVCNYSGEEVLVSINKHFHEGLALQELYVSSPADPRIHVSTHKYSC